MTMTNIQNWLPGLPSSSAHTIMHVFMGQSPCNDKPTIPFNTHSGARKDWGTKTMEELS